MADFLNQESKITLDMLRVVDSSSRVTQRSLADELGIALGLVNAYLKRCAKKGLIKISEAPANRYAYYLTPKGFAEKSRLTAVYLNQTFRLFRSAREEYSGLISKSLKLGHNRVAIIGQSDLVDIVLLCASEMNVSVVGMVANGHIVDQIFGFPVVQRIEDLPDADIFVLADLTDPQGAYDRLSSQVAADRILSPLFFNISLTKRIENEEITET